MKRRKDEGTFPRASLAAKLKTFLSQEEVEERMKVHSQRVTGHEVGKMLGQKEEEERRKVHI
jgi:hypothetical protein